MVESESCLRNKCGDCAHYEFIETTHAHVNCMRVNKCLLHSLSVTSHTQSFLDKNKSDDMHHICLEVDDVNKAIVEGTCQASSTSTPCGNHVRHTRFDDDHLIIVVTRQIRNLQRQQGGWETARSCRVQHGRHVRVDQRPKLLLAALQSTRPSAFVTVRRRRRIIEDDNMIGAVIRDRNMFCNRHCRHSTEQVSISTYILLATHSALRQNGQVDVIWAGRTMNVQRVPAIIFARQPRFNNHIHSINLHPLAHITGCFPRFGDRFSEWL
ncbi:unnamed protein product [Sphagnum balticum]